MKAGERVDDVFVLAEKTLARKKDGGSYLNIVVSDKTGRLKGVAWEEIERINNEAALGDFVRIRGDIGEYKGDLQLIVRSMSALSSDRVDPEDFMPVSRRDPERMFERLVKLASTINTPYLKQLMASFWEDETFVTRFKKAPAAKKMHHAYLGGLLEHTLSLALLADRVSDHYSGINRDLLLTGAMLHDIGKTEELEYEHRIDYSNAGRLLNHIVIGIELLDKKIAAIENFPEKTALLLKHLIVSHHGARELGSPEPPKTLEAVLLNFLDDIDAKINGIREFMDAEDAGGDWTGYHRLLERFFYKGKPDDPTSGQ